jgi:hypothetical protein
VRGEAVLSGAHEVGGKQQKPVGAGALSRRRQFDRHGGAVTAAGDHRKPPRGFGDSGADDSLDLRRREREELARAARGEQSGQFALQSQAQCSR